MDKSLLNNYSRRRSLFACQYDESGKDQAKNNPYRYSDPNGLFAIALFFVPSLVEVSFTGVVTLISAKVVAEAFIGSLIATGLGIGVYQLNKALNHNKDYIALNNEAVVEEAEEEKKKKKTRTKQNVIDTYAPDRPLPVTQDGVPIPDTDAPHTQLRTQDGVKGKYPKAREFDAKS